MGVGEKADLHPKPVHFMLRRRMCIRATAGFADGFRRFELR